MGLYSMKNFTGCFSILLAVVLCLGGCRGSTEKVRPADTVTVALSSEPKRLNPVFLTDFTSYAVSGLIFSGLTRFDKDMKITGDLAESWDIRNGGRNIRFHLKKGVLWHDGTEFTAEDVVFTYKTVTSPNVATPRSSNFGSVKEVNVVDPYTIEVLYHEPFGSALESWSIGIIPKHILAGRDINDSLFDRDPIGTGPYRLKEWVSGQRLRLESFDRYHAGKPGIEKLILRIIPDSATQLLELKNGSIDIMELDPSQYRNDMNQGTIASNFRKYSAPSYRYGFLGLNLIEKRFQDKRFRQALSHAIDKDAIIKAVLSGYGSRSTGPYPPQAWYYSHEATDYRYDPRKAVALLEESGWKRGADDLFQKNGFPLSFTVLTNYENRENIKTAQIIQSNLREIGIRTNISTLEWQAFRHTAVAKHQFHAVLLSRAYLWDPDVYDLWHSSKTREGEWNFLSYKNKEVDELLEKGRRTIAVDKREKIYHRLHELLAEEQPCIFLYNADLLFIAHKRIKGITPSPAGMLSDIVEWQVEQ